MKKVLVVFALAVFTTGMVVSCEKPNDLTVQASDHDEEPDKDASDHDEEPDKGGN